MQIPILYEDTDVVIINKPFGVIVNRAETVKEQTVQDWVEEKYQISNLKSQISKEHEDFISRSGVVHRIDKETSGCLIIAKNPESFFAVQAAFKERVVKKEYVALTHGKLIPETGEINAPIGRLPWNRQRFGVVPGGKEAHTKYTVATHYQDEDGTSYTLVRLQPTTGRTHQLRVHLKYIGFPIVGDYLYAGRKTQRDDRVWCERVFLHAAKISFPQPKTKVPITVEASLPEELEHVLQQLSAHETT